MSPLSLRRLSDERLSSRLASGEAAAFDELYRRYVHRLAAYGGHLLGDAAAGEDVAHVALMNAYQALRAGRLPGHVRPWLYRIAHNAAVDLLTRRRELPLADVQTAGMPTADEEDTRSQPAARGALLAALAELPERQRRAYVLRELHGLKVAEVGAELALSTQQVEQALFSARNRMTELLVFGERLTCETARRLAGGPLDWAERRAVRSHARSCRSCRSALGSRAAAVGLLPALDWLRGLASAAVGGGGGVAVAKVGAMAATATLVAGIPAAGDVARQSERSAVAVPKADRHAPAAAPRVARTTAVDDRAGASGRRGDDGREGRRSGRDGGRATAEVETRGSSGAGSSHDVTAPSREVTVSSEGSGPGGSGSLGSGSGRSGPGTGSGDSGSGDSRSGDSGSGDSGSGDSGSGDSGPGDSGPG